MRLAALGSIDFTMKTTQHLSKHLADETSLIFDNSYSQIQVANTATLSRGLLAYEAFFTDCINTLAHAITPLFTHTPTSGKHTKKRSATRTQYARTREHEKQHRKHLREKRQADHQQNEKKNAPGKFFRVRTPRGFFSLPSGRKKKMVPTFRRINFPVRFRLLPSPGRTVFLHQKQHQCLTCAYVTPDAIRNTFFTNKPRTTLSLVIRRETG